MGVLKMSRQRLSVATRLCANTVHSWEVVLGAKLITVKCLTTTNVLLQRMQTVPLMHKILCSTAVNTDINTMNSSSNKKKKKKRMKINMNTLVAV
jgi:hypothetical protein